MKYVEPVSEPVVVSRDDVDLFARRCGEGDLIVLLHGFPETSASWTRHLPILADAGFEVVAIDLPGMGRSSVPEEETRYAITEIVADVLAVADHLGHARFHVVGNDLGALAAWHTALLAPERVVSVTGMSLPYFKPGNLPPLELLGFLADEHVTPYLLRFVEEGAAEEMDADPVGWVEGCLASISGLVDESHRLTGMVPTSGPVASVFVPGLQPTFLTDAERTDITGCYARSGFGGAMHWYRRLDPDWELLREHHGALITAPAQFIGGEADPVRIIADGGLNELRFVASDLRAVMLLPGVGHWPHLEALDETVEAIVSLARSA